MSSSPATSAAGKLTTSRRISTARWRGGSSWIAARKASEIVSRSTVTASGPGWPAAISSSSESGYGCTHGNAATDGPAPDRALAGTARRASRRSVSRQALVATRYSQVRGLDRPWKHSRERQARRKTSCTCSSASSKDPSIR
jgi:hypothetical protein